MADCVLCGSETDSSRTVFPVCRECAAVSDQIPPDDPNVELRESQSLNHPGDAREHRNHLDDEREETNLIDTAEQQSKAASSDGDRGIALIFFIVGIVVLWLGISGGSLWAALVGLGMMLVGFIFMIFGVWGHLVLW